jgi:hypothetical protein
MLPDTNDGPRGSLQTPINEAIPGLIASQLDRPIRSICARSIPVVGTSVPVATVYEDRHAGTRKDNVDADGNVNASNGGTDSIP